MIKRITSIGKTKEAGVGQYADVTYMGKSIETQVFHDYGFYSSPPVGSFGFCLNPRSEETDRISMMFHPKHHPIDIKAGETIIGNFVVKASLKFDQDGNGILELPSNLVIHCANLNATVSGDATVETSNLNVNASGNVQMKSSSMTITSPTIALDGAVSATQGMSVAGSMENNGIDIGSNHKHKSGSLLDSAKKPVTGNTGDPI